MRDLDNLFAALARAPFRQKFQLQEKDLDYLNRKGIETIMLHADDFINQRLAADFPLKDGKQTPYKGHPVFVAQHATACCCRGCLEKWHQIPKGRKLNADEKTYILKVIKFWLLLVLKQ